MATKKFIGRVINKHDLEVNWLKATNFIPLDGELIVYDREIDENGEILKDIDGNLLIPENRKEKRDAETNEIISLSTGAPESGVSCQSAGWIAEQGANLVVAGGMGGRPMMMFEQLEIPVISGCPELPIKDVVTYYLNNTLEIGQNSCGHGEGHVCHGHGEGHTCGHHH